MAAAATAADAVDKKQEIDDVADKHGDLVQTGTQTKLVISGHSSTLLGELISPTIDSALA